MSVNASASVEEDTATDTSASTSSDDARGWPAIAALGWLVVVLALVTGPIGAVAGIAAAAAWYTLGTPYAIAAGTVVLATVSPAPTATTVGGVTLAFLGLVLVPAIHSDRPIAEGAVALTSAAALVGIGWFLGQSQPLWVAAATLLGCTALAGYALHRYELVRLGLVPEIETETETDLTNADEATEPGAETGTGTRTNTATGTETATDT